MRIQSSQWPIWEGGWGLLRSGRREAAGEKIAHKGKVQEFGLRIGTMREEGEEAGREKISSRMDCSDTTLSGSQLDLAR
jgi:hypothetical protein